MSGADAGRRPLVVTVALLVAAAVALGASGELGWARVGFEVPLRGTVPVEVTGADLLPALGALALLALAAVAAVLGTGGWARMLLGAVLLAAAVPPLLGVPRISDQDRLAEAGTTAAQLPARSVPDGTVTPLPAGPVLAVAGAVLLAAAGLLLLVRGHRMPRLSRRYRAPALGRAPRTGAAEGGGGPAGSRTGEPDNTQADRRPDDRGAHRGSDGGVSSEYGKSGHYERLWERLDAGEDPTGDPR